MERDLIVAKTYSVSIETIGQVSDLAQRTGISMGAVVRAAVARLYDQLQDEEALAEFVKAHGKSDDITK
jgi:hypothetical protein